MLLVFSTNLIKFKKIDQHKPHSDTLLLFMFIGPCIIQYQLDMIDGRMVSGHWAAIVL